MFSKKDPRQPKRAKPGYFYSIVSVSLVLTILGLFGLILIYAKNLSAQFKENIKVEIELKRNTKDVDAMLLQKKIEAEEFTKSTDFISIDEAAEIVMNDIDPEFKTILGEGDEWKMAVYPSINLYLHAAFANVDSIEKIKAYLQKEPNVVSVDYKGYLVENIDRNDQYLTIIIGILGLVLFLITLTLIDHTIRLAMFSNRFLIRSMQLVGATRWFIIRPYLMRAIYNGILSGILAGIFLAGLVYLMQERIPGLERYQDFLKFGALLISVILIGIIMSWVSTYFSVLKYLKMKLDDLY